MGIHEWSYDNQTVNDARYKVPWAKAEAALASIKVEVELGFDVATAVKAGRCLNCDVQTVFTASACIGCDACVDICPMDCITFTDNGPESELRQRLKAPALNLTQALYVAGPLKTTRVMVKDEDVCLHCGLCAERCPTGAWDIQKVLAGHGQSGHTCRPGRRCSAQRSGIEATHKLSQAGATAAAAQDREGRGMKRIEAINDFRHQICQRQRLGLGQRQ